MVRPGLDFFSLVFAVFKAGVVPVSDRPGDATRKPAVFWGRADRSLLLVSRRPLSGHVGSSAGDGETVRQWSSSWNRGVRVLAGSA